MAPERVAKRFRRLYGRCRRELARFEDADGLACARLSKVATIWDRWHLLEREELYTTSATASLLEAAGLKQKVLAKQASVLQRSVEDLEGAM